MAGDKLMTAIKMNKIGKKIEHAFVMIEEMDKIEVV